VSNTNTYYNNTGLSGEELDAAMLQAGRQDRAVLHLMHTASGAMSPSYVWQELIRRDEIDSLTPLTSIRRSITNLTRKGLLVKTEEKTIGLFGRPEFLWLSVDAGNHPASGQVDHTHNVVDIENAREVTQLTLFEEGA